MIDPLAWLIDWYFGLFRASGLGGVIVQVSVLCMMGSLCLRGLMMARDRHRERQVAQVGFLVARRVQKLLPMYDAALEEYVTFIDERVGSHPALVSLANAIDREVKCKAERDFCALDVGRPESVAILHLQLAHLINTKETTT